MKVSSNQIAKIKQLQEHSISRVILYKLEDEQVIINEIRNLSSVLCEEKPYPNTSLVNNFYSMIRFNEFCSILLQEKELQDLFEINHPFIIDLYNLHVPDRNYWIWNFIIKKISSLDELKGKPFLDKVLKKGIDDHEIISKAYNISPEAFIRQGEYGDEDTAIGAYYKDKLLAKGGLFKVKQEGLFEFLKELSNNQGYNNTALSRANMFKYFYFYAYENIKENILDYAVYLHRQRKTVNIEVAKFLVFKEGDEYAGNILRLLNKYSVNPLEGIKLIEYMTENGERNYDSDLIAFADNEMLKNDNYDHSFIAYFFEFLRGKNIDIRPRMETYFNSSLRIDTIIIKYVDNLYGVDSLPFMMKILDREEVQKGYGLMGTVRSTIDQYDYSLFLNQVIDYLLNRVSKNEIGNYCSSIAKQEPAILPLAIDLLRGKTVKDRLLGARILAEVKGNENVDELLNQTLEKETNDTTRNTILESIKKDRFKSIFNIDQVRNTIASAKARKKLSKWGEKWIDETKLPALHWNNGEAFSDDEKRFLFYRMRQTKGINSDPEAKQMILNMDLNRSEDMAMFLLQSFIDSNSDTKFKYYLTLCGLLGNDNVLNKLDSLFRKSISDKRIKMAEYVLGAISMIGSDKALRIIEVISRKYSNKKPKLAEAALNAMDAAAEELNITKDQLADRIVPNFGFEGIFKSFNAGGDDYRAYISDDFRLNFINDDNKIRKSVPPATAPTLKKEFKEIAKEVKIIVKSQADRLERYLINERTWKGDNWKSFFFENPIMFVYGLKLLWAIFDDQNQIKTVFYCDEDASMYDIHDDEVEVHADDTIKILHPLMLTDTERENWKEKVYEMELQTIFPILERKLFFKDAGELEKFYTVTFNKQEIPKGADFVAPYLLKKGWLKSTGDGGYLHFSKVNGDQSIIANANIEGPAVYYQGGTSQAFVYEIAFSGSNWNAKVLIKDIPAIFYSETLADVSSLIQAI